jgi:hypothetical protein
MIFLRSVERIQKFTSAGLRLSVVGVRVNDEAMGNEFLNEFINL